MAITCIPVLILLFSCSFCQSDDQLTQAKPLSADGKLISKSGVFALGFFSPSYSKIKSLYIGIWYHNLPECTVVWVANRNNPITTPSAKLTITHSAELVLFNSDGSALWRTVNNATIGSAGAVAVLRDSGNFVIQSPGNTVVWQSFDHPTDTILPSMKFVLNYKEHVVGHLVAWKGPDDPSTGEFSCSADPSSNLQIFVWKGASPYYRTTVFKGISVGGDTYRSNATSMVYYVTIVNQDGFYFMYSVSEGSPYTRVLLDSTGKMMFLTWNNYSSSWIGISEAPRECDLYNSCGPFGYCDFTGIAPTCRCLDGFEPIDGLNLSRGCRRKEALKCEKENHFVTLPGMKVPDKFLHVKNRSFNQCSAECSRNCSCVAYAYANISSNAGAMADPSRCLIWIGDLVDTGNQGIGENLYW